MFRRAAFLLCLALVPASSFAWYSEDNPDHVPSVRFDYDKSDIDGDKTVNRINESHSEWEQRFGAAIRLPVFDEFSVELRGGNVQKRTGPNGFSMGGASYGASAIFYLDYSRKNEVRWTPIARHPGYEISSDGEIRKIQGTGDEQPVNVVPLPEESHQP